jgi:type IV secretory pathway VirB3-like protein
MVLLRSLKYTKIHFLFTGISITACIIIAVFSSAASIIVLSIAQILLILLMNLEAKQIVSRDIRVYCVSIGFTSDNVTDDADRDYHMYTIHPRL